jgi:hypothetical protein
MIRIVCLAAALVGGAGCGLIDSDMAQVDLDLAEQQVIVDTADWELTDEGQMPAVECADTPRVCASQVDSWCGANDLCKARCGGDTCAVDIVVSLWHEVNLAEEAPELEQLGGEPLVNVTVDQVAFTVSENTLNMTTPALTVSVAPFGIIATDGRDAEVIGTIPAIEPGQTVDHASLELAADGQAILAERMLDYETPFNVIVASTVALQAGDDVPSGRLVAGIRVSARARTGL